jgi:hypothetical protein
MNRIVVLEVRTGVTAVINELLEQSETQFGAGP